MLKGVLSGKDIADLLARHAWGENYTLNIKHHAAPIYYEPPLPQCTGCEDCA